MSKLHEEQWELLNKIKKGNVMIYSMGGNLKEIGINEEDDTLIFNKYNEKAFKDICAVKLGLSASLTKELKVYIDMKKQLIRRPRVYKKLHLFDQHHKSVGWEASRTFDGSDFYIKRALPVINEDADADLVERIFQTLIPNSRDAELVRKFLAQLFFEDRTKSRPTLILHGSRGSGKTLLIKAFMQPFMQGDLGLMDGKKEQSRFDAYKDNRLIWGEEMGRAVWDVHRLCKEMSGSSSVSVERKGVDAQMVHVTAWTVLTSNEMPVSISEPIVSENNNQYIMVEYHGNLQDKRSYKELEQKYPDFVTVTEYGMGKWLRDKVLPMYKEEMQGQLQEKVGRYGFMIPITKSHHVAVSLGYDTNTEKALEIFSRLLNYDVSDDTFRYIPDNNVPELLALFKTKGLFNNILFDLPGIPKMKQSAFKHSLAKIGDVMVDDKVVVKRVNNKSYRFKQYKIDLVAEKAQGLLSKADTTFVKDIFDDFYGEA